MCVCESLTDGPFHRLRTSVDDNLCDWRVRELFTCQETFVFFFFFLFFLKTKKTTVVGVGPSALACIDPAEERLDGDGRLFG